MILNLKHDELGSMPSKNIFLKKSSISSFIHGMMNPKLPLLYPTYA
jgi:hypothetical protein